MPFVSHWCGSCKPKVLESILSFHLNKPPLKCDSYPGKTQNARWKGKGTWFTPSTTTSADVTRLLVFMLSIGEVVLFSRSYIWTSWKCCGGLCIRRLPLSLQRTESKRTPPSQLPAQWWTSSSSRLYQHLWGIHASLNSLKNNEGGTQTASVTIEPDIALLIAETAEYLPVLVGEEPGLKMASIETVQEDTWPAGTSSGYSWKAPSPVCAHNWQNTFAWREKPYYIIEQPTAYEAHFLLVSWPRTGRNMRRRWLHSREPADWDHCLDHKSAERPLLSRNTKNI